MVSKYKGRRDAGVLGFCTIYGYPRYAVNRKDWIWTNESHHQGGDPELYRKPGIIKICSIYPYLLEVSKFVLLLLLTAFTLVGEPSSFIFFFFICSMSLVYVDVIMYTAIWL